MFDTGASKLERVSLLAKMNQGRLSAFNAWLSNAGKLLYM